MLSQEENIFNDLNQVTLTLIGGKMDIALELLDHIEAVYDRQKYNPEFVGNLRKFISQYKDGAVFLNAIANGNLDIPLPEDPLRENYLIAEYKQLHSNLNHLTWQMQQIVRGDFQQKVRFLGEFSVAFNKLIDSLREKQILEDQVRLQVAQLQNLNAEKDKFFSIIAHDLRNPFNAFLGFTEIMVEEISSLTTDEIRIMAENMRKSAVNLYRLLENLLEWSLLQRGVTKFSPTTFLLKPKVTECLALILDPALKKGIEIINDIPDDAEVVADVHMFEAVIRNLVSNAIKFTRGGGHVTVSARVIPGQPVEIAVADTGIGMSREMIDQLFRIDVQTSRRGTEGEPSTGLGLILCRDFIEKHGGTLRVESEENKGTVFYFTVNPG